ncbi:uncharacterized protein PGTG_22518 [Puccinia graminis f. sp. tritici CRL 75-36-700-3]|uniref:Uncharacterized protein n=1 Tax=Puccinia graminis f. sp. tritici (strain CRL 75-36-700-3 / race SCCL) TaxID=418459 RepID=H6QUT1_PUCGT|nr:uncharacterized protein PGTG_22518 [Puccinia graminis f. sp. tritici CRL 75-36-700-3]EHS64839.1 hypothetical protein PGTG_22518 [Puccinia graminis f. sp. tritici CRL 75-36-700-3]
MLETGFWSVCERSIRAALLKHPSNKSDSETKPNVDLEAVGLENVRFQGMRTAYFTLDKSSSLDPLVSQHSLPESQDHSPPLFDHHSLQNQLVLNWIVSLKEDSGKKIG